MKTADFKSFVSKTVDNVERAKSEEKTKEKRQAQRKEK